MTLIEALERIKAPPPAGAPDVRVFLGCGFTPLHVETFLAAQLRARLHDRRPVISAGRYGDLAGSLESTASRGEFDAAVVVVEWPDLDPRLGVRALGGWNYDSLPDVVATAAAQGVRLERAIAGLAARAPTVVSLTTLPLPPLFAAGPTEISAHEAALRQVVANMTAALAADPRVRIVSQQALDLASPPGQRLDLRSSLNADFPYTLAHAGALAGLLAELASPSPPKKGLITDLDDTLWGGLLGEVGAEGVSWDLDRRTHLHALYQQLLASLASAGVLVAAASKNDPALVETALARGDLILRKDQIFPVAAGWGRKSDSVRHILESWNIAADAVVFVDDSPMELEEVSSSHPGVECVLFPSRDPAALWRTLSDLRRRFGKSAVSEEDFIRLQSLRTAAAIRDRFSPEHQASDAFLRSLNSEVEVRLSKAPSDPRCLELINKTNQFNLNGRRLTEADMTRSLAREDAFLLEVSYKDKFGPLGKISVLLGRTRGQRLEIDTWVVSCRAFSRRVEYKIIDFLFDRFSTAEIAFDYTPTGRNALVRDFFDDLKASNEGGATRLTWDNLTLASPPFFGTLHEA